MNDPGSSDGASLPSDEDGNTGELPEVDFSTFVLSLGHSALMHLGSAPDPNRGAGEPNLVMAKQTIDLLALIEEKTRGNLTGEEERLMEQLLYDLRSGYLSSKASK